MGLSEEAAGRIIKGVQNQRLIGNLQAVKASGALTLDKVLPTGAARAATCPRCHQSLFFGNVYRTLFVIAATVVQEWDCSTCGSHPNRNLTPAISSDVLITLFGSSSRCWTWWTPASMSTHSSQHSSGSTSTPSTCDTALMLSLQVPVKRFYSICSVQPACKLLHGASC